MKLKSGQFVVVKTQEELDKVHYENPQGLATFGDYPDEDGAVVLSISRNRKLWKNNEDKLRDIKDEPLEKRVAILKEIGFEEYTEEREMIEGDWVYVSSDSKELALKNYKAIFIRKCSNGVICVKSYWENEYREGRTFETEIWEYAVPVPKSELKKITIEVTVEQEKEIRKMFNIR